MSGRNDSKDTAPPPKEGRKAADRFARQAEALRANLRRRRDQRRAQEQQNPAPDTDSEDA